MESDYNFLNNAITDMLAKITSVGGIVDGALQPVYFITGCSCCWCSPVSSSCGSVICRLWPHSSSGTCS